MKETKYVCPDCGSKIAFWKEYFLYKKQIINPNTGVPNKTIITTKLQEHGCNDMSGFECTKCNWSINTCHDNVPEELATWFEEHFEELDDDLQ